MMEIAQNRRLEGNFKIDFLFPVASTPLDELWAGEFDRACF